MKYAVIQTGGKQYQVKEGETLRVEKLAVTGNEFVFDKVLLMVDGDKVEVGMPILEGVKVYASVIGEVKGEKIEVLKYKSKSRYRKHTGHRQKYSSVRIEGIGSKPAAAPKVTKAAPVKKVAAKKPVTKKVAAKKSAAK